VGEIDIYQGLLAEKRKNDKRGGCTGVQPEVMGFCQNPLQAIAPGQGALKATKKGGISQDAARENLRGNGNTGKRQNGGTGGEHNPGKKVGRQGR